MIKCESCGIDSFTHRSIDITQDFDIIDDLMFCKGCASYEKSKQRLRIPSVKEIRARISRDNLKE